MKTSLLKAFLAGSIFCGGALRAEQPIFPSLSGGLVSVQGKSVKKFDEAPLAQAKYFGIYYSASWCGPCKSFTPKLVEFYNRTKPSHPEFELIFVSSDRDEKSMEAYMEEDKMPWPGLRYSKIRSNRVLTSYSGRGIPCLVFVDAAGKVLSHSYEGTKYVGPTKVMADIEKTLGSAPAATTAGSTTTSGSAGSTTVTPGGTKPAGTQGSNFDDFFKKKN